MKDFTENPKEEIWGKSKFSGLGGVLETFYRSTTLQEVGILHTLVLVPIFGLKMVEHVKGPFGQKKCPKPDFLRLSEGKLRLDEGLCLGEGKLCLDEGLR